MAIDKQRMKELHTELYWIVKELEEVSEKEESAGMKIDSLNSDLYTSDEFWENSRTFSAMAEKVKECYEGLEEYM